MLSSIYMNVKLKVIIFHSLDTLDIFIDNTHLPNVFAGSSLSSFPLGSGAARIIKTLSELSFYQRCFNSIIVRLLNSIFKHAYHSLWTLDCQIYVLYLVHSFYKSFKAHVFLRYQFIVLFPWVIYVINSIMLV
jgi:hypothetical protein